MAALTLLAAACRQSDPPPAESTERAATVAAMAAACAPDSLRPVAAAPAGGLWIGVRAAPRARVAALIGPASPDGERARITRRVETLEVSGSDSLRLATDTASVRLALLPPFQPSSASVGVPGRSATEPAAVYAITPLVLLASYEPCAGSAGEPRIRYLRHDQRGAVAIDVMLRRESGEAMGLLR